MEQWKWNRSYDEDENLDWSIMRDGPIVKYFSSDILKDHIDQLEKMRYRIIEVSTLMWTKDNFHKKIRDAFDFPDYYGENLAAFKDCLGDMFDRKFNGLAIVFRHFDSFHSKEQDLSEGILDAIFSESWAWLLTGKKLMALVQSDDPDFEIGMIGGFNPSWNGMEWLNSRRGK